MGKPTANQRAQRRNEMRQTVTVEVRMTNDDLANIIAFGNRASMTGAEADTWVELKRKLFATLAHAEQSLVEELVGPDQEPAPPEEQPAGGSILTRQ
jgi:hypothetical protein